MRNVQVCGQMEEELQLLLQYITSKHIGMDSSYPNYNQTAWFQSSPDGPYQISAIISKLPISQIFYSLSTVSETIQSGGRVVVAAMLLYVGPNWLLTQIPRLKAWRNCHH